MSRFTFSSEPYAQERVAAVQATIEELKKEYPEIVSGVLFGSLTKGAARIDSDIDLYVFIDPEKLANKDVLVYKRMNFTRKDGDVRREFTMAWLHFNQEVRDKYANLVRNKIKEKLFGKLTVEQLKDIIVEPLNESVLSYELQQLIDSYSTYPNQPDENGELEKDSIKHLTETHDIPPPQGSSIKAADPLWYVFSYDIGGDLSTYRTYVIEYLSKRGTAGESAWHNIIRNVEIWEQKARFEDLPTTINYPRLLEEARNLYT
jgi:predicted nucleotidyltransferase